MIFSLNCKNDESNNTIIIFPNFPFLKRICLWLNLLRSFNFLNRSNQNIELFILNIFAHENDAHQSKTKMYIINFIISCLADVTFSAQNEQKNSFALFMSDIVVVGDSICGGRGGSKYFSNDDVFLRGFNTVAGYNPDEKALSCEGAGEIVAAVTGHVEVTDKVVSVRGRFSRYIPEIGDVIVGRIIEVVGNKWTVDINCSQSAVMLLSNVSEPGGILRRRGRNDELSMRALFDQGDVIAAEVQRVSPDGVPFLQSRAGEKYGRISSIGKLVSVRAALMKRSKHHFVSYPQFFTNLIFGANGNIWIAESSSDATADSAESRQGVARVGNCITAMNERRVSISPESVEKYAEASVTLGISSADILSDSAKDLLFAGDLGSAGTKRRRKCSRLTLRIWFLKKIFSLCFDFFSTCSLSPALHLSEMLFAICDILFELIFLFLFLVLPCPLVMNKMNHNGKGLSGLCLKQLFSCVEKTGEPATIFISSEMGDLEEVIDQIKSKGLRMAPVPPGCISVFPPLPMNDDELFHFCKEYCLGSITTRADIRRELYVRSFSSPHEMESPNFNPYDCVVRIAELCLLVCNSPPSVAAHLYASSPYLQVSPVRSICETIASILQKEEVHRTEDGEEMTVTNHSTRKSEEEANGLHHSAEQQDDGFLTDLTGLEKVDDSASVPYFQEKDFQLKVCRKAADCLQEAATTNNLRARTNGGEAPETGIVGYYDYLGNPTTKKCRETQFMRKHWANIEKGCSEFLQKVDALYAKHAPSHYKLQEQVIPKSYQLLETVFSTITVNRNFRTAPHTDKGDFKSGLAALCVLKGRFEGCHLAIPLLGKAFVLKPGDILFFDASLLHGNTEVYEPSSSWERISVVCYLRNGLMSATCEEERRKQLNGIMQSKLDAGVARSAVINLNKDEEFAPPMYVPAKLAGKLASAQISALSFIADRIHKSSGCIISMEMGLGKTLVALTTCFSCFYERPEDDILVVAPKPTIPNWIQEISKWAPSGLTFTSCIYADGCIASGFENRVMDFNERRRIKREEKVGTLMIINPELLQSFFNRCSEFKPTLIIVDEGHCLGSKANRLMEHLNKFGCSRRVVLSGTPLQNDATELYRLVKWVYEGVTKVLPYQTFAKMETVITEYTNGNNEAFREAVNAQEFINEWMKAFVFREVDRELPPLHDYLLVCGSSDKQKVISQLHLGGLKANEHRPAHLATHPLSFMDLASVLATKRGRDESEEPSAAIHTLDDLTSLETTEASFSEEHSPNSATSQRAEVEFPPASVAPLDVNDKELMSSLEEDRQHFQSLLQGNVSEFVSHSGKLSLLLGIMKHVEMKGEKAILFSQYIMPQDTIGRVLVSAGYTTFSMRGRDSQEKRRATVKEFSQHQGTCLLLLSTKIAAFGHDFTEANHVFLFDSWWNPQADAQAIARAYRRNQVRPVTVYRLASEVEDQHIIKIQIRKLALFRSIIHGCVSRSCRPEEMTDCADSEANEGLKELWESLKQIKLDGGDRALHTVYRYSDAVRTGEE
eukprot:gene296-169_t